MFPLILCQAQGTHPNTLCTAFFMPSWSREVVKYTSLDLSSKNELIFFYLHMPRSDTCLTNVLTPCKRLKYCIHQKKTNLPPSSHKKLELVILNQCL
jgi:hypothetical protein